MFLKIDIFKNKNKKIKKKIKIKNKKQIKNNFL